jgi:Caspase domain
VIRTVCVGAALVLAGWSGSARAEIRRLAVVVGNNEGSGRSPALRYAEHDAERMAEVLVDLGGLGRGDVELLRGAPVEALRASLERVSARVHELQAGPRTRVVLLFYFSGHSDGEALELGHHLLRFSEVRRWLEATGAAVRLVILDSCRSGGLLAVKGGTLGPAFDVRLADNMASTGEAVITSSAAREAALESSEIGGSFFSHHLISGLRGAADTSGDGLVTLSEAYQYAFARTVNATADTTIGPQHPGYDYRLSGRGELVLTRLAEATAVLEMPGGFDRLLVIDRGRREVVVEVGSGAARRLAVRPGDYAVRAWRNGRVFAAQAQVTSSRPVRLAGSDLVEVPAPTAVLKGEANVAAGARAPSSSGPVRVSLALGIVGGAGDSPAWLPSLALGVASPGGRWSLALAGSTGRARGARETHLQVSGGPRWRRGSRLRLVTGLEVGGGAAFQSVPGRRLLWSGLATGAGIIGAEWAGGSRAGVALTLVPGVAVVRRDRAVVALFLPALWLATTF